MTRTQLSNISVTGASDRDVPSIASSRPVPLKSNVRYEPLTVDKARRAAQKGQKPAVIWFTGLSGAGKTTIANLVDSRLNALGHHTALLDGDNLRHGLNQDLGFTDADRAENVRRVAEVSRLMVQAGLIVLTASISPFRSDRETARSLLSQGEFVEVHVDSPLEVVEERDTKGLYRKARSGELKNFTGIDSPYEKPVLPDIRVPGHGITPGEAAERVLSLLQSMGIAASSMSP